MKALAAGIGALMILVGLVWTLQGLGYLEGSPMTGETMWAVIGPVLAGLGVALVWVAFRGRRSAD
jgi:uncharacterized membrane-anchored protein YitT (DUF2179 family)